VSVACAAVHIRSRRRELRRTRYRATPHCRTAMAAAAISPRSLMSSSSAWTTTEIHRHAGRRSTEPPGRLSQMTSRPTSHQRRNRVCARRRSAREHAERDIPPLSSRGTRVGARGRLSPWTIPQPDRYCSGAVGKEDLPPRVPRSCHTTGWRPQERMSDGSNMVWRRWSVAMT